eukprot:m.216230 g.216230  ORF g.216230 m.216230 type:complete len:70 (+) comp16983_c0_seq3:145-354(+)
MLYSLSSTAPRSVTTLTDLDVAIHVVDECLHDLEDYIESDVVRLIMEEIGDEFRYHILDMVRETQIPIL